MRTLIAPDNAWLLWAIILAGVAVSIYLEQNYSWAAKLSGPVVALVLAMTLSNLKVMPVEAPAYDLIWNYLVPLAIPLLLFRANLLEILRTTGSMFFAFHLSTLGTMLGAILATLFVGHLMERPEQLAAIMTGSYVGGSVNFFALKESYKVPENLTGPLLVADNFIMAGVFVLLLTLAGSRFMRRHFPHPHSQDENVLQAQALSAEQWKRKEISLLDIAKGLAVAFAIAAVGQQIAGWFKNHLPPGMLAAVVANGYIWITTLSVIAATCFSGPIRRIQGADELGGYLLYVFLFAIGLPADLWQVLTRVPIMFVFCLIIALTNVAVTLGVGRLFKLGLEELLLCSNASLGGPPTAAAMAISRGWSKLVLPALLMGLYGYIIGTFVGIVIGEFLLGLRK